MLRIHLNLCLEGLHGWIRCFFVLVLARQSLDFIEELIDCSVHRIDLLIILVLFPLDFLDAGEAHRDILLHFWYLLLVILEDLLNFVVVFSDRHESFSHVLAHPIDFFHNLVQQLRQLVVIERDQRRS